MYWLHIRRIKHNSSTWAPLKDNLLCPPLSFPNIQNIFKDLYFVFISNILFLLIIWEFHTMCPITLDPHSSQVYPPTLVPIHKSTSASPVCVAHILAGVSSTPPNPCWKPSQFLRALFNDFLSGLFLFCLLGGGRLSQKPSMSLILGYEFAVIKTTVKETSLPIAATGSTDRRNQHGL